MNHERDGAWSRRRPRPVGRRQWALAILSAFCLLASAASLAVLHTGTGPLTNLFQPGQVSCRVLEGADGSTFDGVTKTDVRIRNTGNTDAYIRAAIVVTWVAADGDVFAGKPQAGVGYTVTYSENEGWEPGFDGFWYYTRPVAAGADTADLIKSLSAVNSPEGFRLSVKIAASSIQASPGEAVIDNWTAVESVNGTSLVIKKEGA